VILACDYPPFFYCKVWGGVLLGALGMVYWVVIFIVKKWEKEALDKVEIVGFRCQELKKGNIRTDTSLR
jgi:hypothetical protein